MKKTGLTVLSIYAVFALYSCSDGNKSVTSAIFGNPHESTEEIKSNELKAYNLTTHIVYGASEDDITMNFIFLPDDGCVLWTGISLMGYEVPLGFGSYDSKSGEIMFNSSNPLNDLWYLKDNPIIKIRENEDGATMYIVEGDYVKELFNNGTKFNLKRNDVPQLDNALVKTRWRAENEAGNDNREIVFISDYKAKVDDKICLYIYRNNEIAITNGDNPIDDEVCVGRNNQDNTFNMKRDGLTNDSSYKFTLKKL